MADEREERIQRLLGALTHDPIQASPELKQRLVQSLWAEQARRAAAPACWRALLAPWPAMPRWTYLTAGLLLLMAFFVIAAWPAERAVLKVEQGVVQVLDSPGRLPPGERRPNLVNQQRDIKVTEGAAITLPEDGAAVISFFDRSQVELAPGTQMTLTQAQPGSLWQPPAVRMQVDAGEVRAQVAHLRSPAERFEVTLPTALISVRGTIFRAWVLSATHTCVATDEGVVLVRLVDPAQSYPEIEVPAGYEVHAILGQPLVLQPQSAATSHQAFTAPTATPDAAASLSSAAAPTLTATAPPSRTATPPPPSETPALTDQSSAPPTTRPTPTLNATTTLTPAATFTPALATAPEAAAAGDSPTPEVNLRADLGVYQMESPDPAAADGKLTYALKIFNNGPADAQTVIVSNTLPAEVMLITTTPPLSSPGGTLVWRLGRLAAGEQRVLLVETRVRSWVMDAFTNTVWLTSATPDADARNNRSLVVTRVTTATDLAITALEFPPVVGAGDIVTCVLDYTNLGPAAAQSVSIALTLAPNVRFESAVSAAPALRFIPAPPAGNGTLLVGNAQPRWILAELPAYASGRLIFTLKVAPGTLGWLTNTLTIGSAVPDLQPANSHYRQTLQAARLADLALARFETPAAVLAGGVLTYSLDYANHGPWAADSVTLTTLLPSGVTFGSVASGSDWSQPTLSGQKLMWTATSLPSGAAGTLVFTATVNRAATGPLTSTTSIGSATADGAAGNERAAATTMVQTPGLHLRATLAPGTVAPRMPFTLTVQLTNTGDVTFAAGALALTATWPLSVTYLAGADGLAPDAGTPLWANSTPLTPGQSLQHTLFLSATEAITPSLYSGLLTLTGRYPAGTERISKTLKLTVRAPAVTLTQAAMPIHPSSQGTRTVTVAVTLVNTGPTPLVALPLQDFYPGEALRFVAAWPAPDVVSPTGALLWRDLADSAPLAPGAPLSVTIVFEMLNPISPTTPLLHTCLVAGARDLYGNVTAPTLNSSVVKPYNVYVPLSSRRD